MRRNGWIVTGGIIGVLRGASGALVGFIAVESIADFPGYALLLIFELLLSLMILAISIFALVKANDPSRSGQIRFGGGAIAAGGGVDAVLTLLLLGNVAGVAASALGTLVALGIIGALLVIGAGKLGAAAAASGDD